MQTIQEDRHMLQIDLKNSSTQVEQYTQGLVQAHSWLQEANGKGSDFVGWVNLPRDYDKEEYQRIKAAAKKIQSDSKALVVIGIGGSYLGARAAIELLRSNNYNLIKKDTPNIYFTGNGLSGDSLQEIVDLLGDEDFSVNVISKSGTTTEPAVAFRFFKALLEKKYGKAEAAKRIYATTDKARGALKNLSTAEGYETFVVPDDVGGRYSVLTAVGLLPIAVAGVDLDQLMAGAQTMMDTCRKSDMDLNPAWQYAAARSDLYAQGKKIEILAGYEPRFRFFAEWWKQLYGESEGKEHKGLFPASVEFTADLHSMGQYIQQGERHLFETVVRFAGSQHRLEVPYDDADGDGLNFLAGKDMDFIATQAMDGTLLAHVEGGVPNLIIRAGSLDAYTCGELIYFFEYACGLSGYLLGVNPFDQPGVEAYKKNMFALLNKPGYEDMGKELRAKLGK
jgi:glucose-6-phosphate isomerase